MRPIVRGYWRIAPADAGEAKKLQFSADGMEDRPGARMRGKRAAALVRRAGAGITPADAGKTRASVGDRYRDEDHPRRDAGKTRWRHKR